MYEFLDNVVDDSDHLEAVWREIDMISQTMHSPTETRAASEKKSGKGFMLPGPMCRDILPAITAIKDKYNTEMNFTFLMNYYGDGDYYKPHIDTSVKTLNIFMSKEDGFTGGDFRFTEENVTIPFKSNSAVLFDSGMLHEVTEVKLKTKESSGRYSLVFFLF